MLHPEMTAALARARRDDLLRAAADRRRERSLRHPHPSRNGVYGRLAAWLRDRAGIGWARLWPDRATRRPWPRT